MERRCTGINRMWITGSEFRRITDISYTIRWTHDIICRFTNSINITTIERLRMFLQLGTAIGWTGQKQACDWPDVAQTKNLRDKTGDLVSDLKISSALKGNIYDFEIHKNTFSSNNSGLTVLEKDTTLIFRSWGFTGKLILTGRKFCLMVVVVSYRFYKKIMQCSYKKHVGWYKL